MSRATKRARSEDAEDSKCEIWIEAKDPREVRKEKKAIRGGDYNTISEKLRHELGLISGPLPESEKANILKAFPKATGKVRLGYSFSKEDEGSRRVTFVVLEEPSHELMLSAANYDAVVSERDSGASCYTVYGKKQKTGILPCAPASESEPC